MRRTTARTLAIALIAPLAFAACAKARPSANEWGCTFGEGMFDSRALKGKYGPGDEGVWTNDQFTTGPADVRSYIVDSDPATADLGARPIEVPARGTSLDGVGVVPVSIETQVRFVFNERFCDWYVDHGRRNEPLSYNASAENAAKSGWAAFLNQSMNQKLIEAARPVVSGEDYVTLYVNGPINDGAGTAYDVLAQELSANLSRELSKDLGGEYFCGPSYVFDGTLDGELEQGCPPLEVTIKRVVPVDATMIQRLEKIVANEEEQKAIQSQNQLQLQQISAEQKRAIAQAEADAATQLAQQETRQEIQVAQANADLAIAQAQAEVFSQRAANASIQAEADAAFCRELAEVGVDCALYAAGESGSYPRIIMEDGAETSVLVDGSAP